MRMYCYLPRRVGTLLHLLQYEVWIEKKKEIFIDAGCMRSSLQEYEHPHEFCP